MLPRQWLRNRVPRAHGWKSFRPTMRTVGNARMTSNRRIIFVSKSFVAQVTARSERCMIPRQHLSRLQLSMQGSRSCPCAGSSNGPTRGPNAGAAQGCITTANSLSRRLGCGWPRHACYSAGSLIRVDFVNTLLADQQPSCLPVSGSRCTRKR